MRILHHDSLGGRPSTALKSSHPRVLTPRSLIKRFWSPNSLMQRVESRRRRPSDKRIRMQDSHISCEWKNETILPAYMAQRPELLSRMNFRTIYFSGCDGNWRIGALVQQCDLVLAMVFLGRLQLIIDHRLLVEADNPALASASEALKLEGCWRSGRHAAGSFCRGSLPLRPQYAIKALRPVLLR